MLIKKPSDIPSSEITPKGLYITRRRFLGGAGALVGAVAAGSEISEILSPSQSALAGTKLQYSQSQYSTSAKTTPLNDITHYKNYYKFRPHKYKPAELAKNFNTRPWTIKVEGLAT